MTVFEEQLDRLRNSPRSPDSGRSGVETADLLAAIDRLDELEDALTNARTAGHRVGYSSGFQDGYARGHSKGYGQGCVDSRSGVNE